MTLDGEQKVALSSSWTASDPHRSLSKVSPPWGGVILSKSKYRARVVDIQAFTVTKRSSLRSRRHVHRGERRTRQIVLMVRQFDV